MGRAGRATPSRACASSPTAAARRGGPPAGPPPAACGVSVDPADDGPGGPRDAIPGLRVFSDRGGAVSRLYGVVVPPGAQGGPAGGQVPGGVAPARAGGGV